MRIGVRKNARALVVLVFVASTGFLGLRVLRTMNVIAANRNLTVATAGSAGQSHLDRLVQAMGDRRQLRQAVAGLPRDPFRAPSATRFVDTGAASARQTPVAADVPALRALVFDHVQPSVQLSCEDAISPWLSQGDTFKGWTVLEIGPGSVWLRNGSRNQELGTK